MIPKLLLVAQTTHQQSGGGIFYEPLIKENTHQYTIAFLLAITREVVRQY